MQYVKSHYPMPIPLLRLLIFNKIFSVGYCGVIETRINGEEEGKKKKDSWYCQE